MDKYLKQLLEKYAKVILPSFGAIVVENEDTGNLMFNEYLSYNDGKLDDLIVSESNKDLQEAQNMIAKYVRDIQVQIDKGESYDIFELGRFYKNQDGDIEFEGNLKDGPSSQDKKDAPKVAATKDSESDTKKEEKPKEDKKETKTEPKKDEVKKETKVDSKDKKDTKTETKSTEKENKFVASKDDNKSKQEVKKDPKPVKKEKAPKPPKKKKEKTPKEGKKKKRFGAFFWIAIIILALASAGLIYVGLNYEEVKSYMGWDKFDDEDATKKETSDETKTEEDESIEFDANGNTATDSTDTSNVEFDQEGNKIKEEGNTEAETKPAPPTEPAQTQTSSAGSHHLIAGSFSNLSNAETLVEDLKSKGLNAKILGEFGGLHFVSAASYNSSQAARSDIDRVRQKAPGSWIFKYNNK